MSRSECTGGAFPVYHEVPLRISFDLGNVMRDVIHQFHTEGFRRLTEDGLKCPSYLVGDDLAVGEGAVGCTIHGRKVLLTFGRLEWRAGQLLIFHRDPVASHGFFEGLEVVARDLMAEPS